MQTSFSQLPTELVVQILSGFSKKELAVIRLVDKRLKLIATALLLLWGNEEKLKIFSAFNSQQLTSFFNNVFEGKTVQFLDKGALQQKEKLILNMIETLNMITSLDSDSLIMSDMLTTQMMIGSWAQEIKAKTREMQEQSKIVDQIMGL